MPTNLTCARVALALVIACTRLIASPRSELWRQTDTAMTNGLPKTAITNLDKILAGTLAEKAYPEAAKALALKSLLASTADTDRFAGKITRLQTALAESSTPVQPLLHAVLADWYWQYFERHRWEYLHRTTIRDAPEKDFTMWDSQRIVDEIERQFRLALSDDASLKTIPVSTWDELLEKGDMPDGRRPTLYDFIVHEALNFYSESERPAEPEEVFEITADDPAFDSVEKFLAWEPRTPDTNSPTLKSARLFQDLLRFHRNAPAPDAAFAQADLDRIVWAWNIASGNNKNERCMAALDGFIQSHRKEEVSSDASERVAGILMLENKRAAAHRVAAEGERRFPNSPGGKLCHNVVHEIEKKGVGISTERIWNAPWPNITVAYCNIDSIELRVIPANWETYLEPHHHRPENLSEAERDEILRRKSAFEWSVKLPAAADYKEAEFNIPAPQTLKSGFYFLAASHKSGGKRDSDIAMTPIWVSDLALVFRSHESSVEGFITTANTGEPIPGAAVSVWHLNNHGDRIPDPTLTTDSNGFFSVTSKEERGYLFRARAHGHEIATSEDQSGNSFGEPFGSNTMACFYTDRAIYRPGQTIQFKGICLHLKPSAADHIDLFKGNAVTVVFNDSNGKEIARQQLSVNDYGSFAGSFIAPRDRLTGQMSISTTGNVQGETVIRVEEYKRPKFEATLDAPKSAPSLGEKVSLTGHAMGYTGAAIDGAHVSYHVVRQPRFPEWRSRWHPHDSYAEQEISHGAVRTAADGSFVIDFVATPDKSISPTNEPVFNFNVHVDVTDSAGETRSADQDVRVGYSALQAELTCDDWQTTAYPVEIKISTKSLDDEPQAAKGKLRIYALQAPDKIERTSFNEDNDRPLDWPLGKIVAEKSFAAGTNGEARLSFRLPIGAYRAVAETKDRFGHAVTAKIPIEVLNPSATNLALKISHLLTAPKWEAQPDDDFTALWGTGYPEGRACIEVARDNKIVQRYWTTPVRTQEQIKVPVTEDLRGGFTLFVTEVHDNRAFFSSHKVDVPWKNKELTIKWEHFTSKLQPGQKETWTAIVTGLKAKRTAAEMVATLYDESLDAFAPLNWTHIDELYRNEESFMQSFFANSRPDFNLDFSGSEPKPAAISELYRHFPEWIAPLRWNASTRTREVYILNAVGYINVNSETGPSVPSPGGLLPVVATSYGISAQGGSSAGAVMPGLPVVNHQEAALKSHPDLAQVVARKNLNETAFFFPQLLSDSNGVVRLTFTMPEALTKWHFMAFAHDKSVRSGFIDDHAVTAKDLMVQPNPPRFLRETDTIEFAVKVSNQSSARQDGTVRLTFNDDATEQSADARLGNTSSEQSFSIPAKESRTYSWRIRVPDGCGFLTYRVVGATDKLSDGEEGAIPVLSRRRLVRESVPLAIRGPATNEFHFDKLLHSGASATLQNQSLTVQMVSNPAWYAVMALPYLMEFPHECNEQLFNRIYANALARHIANSDPKIRRVFDLWRNTPSLDSPLQKNQDLKSVMIQETPWLRDAQKESQSRRNIGILFDNNRLDYETVALREKLMKARLPDGRWPWFAGGGGDDFITLYIMTGLGRLRHLGTKTDLPNMRVTLRNLDQWMSAEMDSVQRTKHPEEWIPDSQACLYLYGRSFFLKDKGLTFSAKHQKSVQFLLGQARKYWMATGCRQSQGHLAIALNRWGGDENIASARAIMKSLKERSASSNEMGMYWNDNGPRWWWYRAPIETQAIMIEAFDEVMNDNAAVDACKVWLLKQKQTQNWPTTKSTADAVYALLLHGSNLLDSDTLVQTKLGDVDVTPGKGEAGTGFYEMRFSGSEVKPALGKITIKKSDNGVAWGGVYWHYLEDIAKINTHTETPLKLAKAVFVKVNTSSGPKLQPMNGPIHVGDELVIRLELRVDRDMEYVHLKDQRASGVEPVNVLSEYKYQDGLGYYESTHDTASHFFIDHLRAGSYVFEYSTRVQLRGEYQTGLAEIECMYAPEFNSHSASVSLVVR